MSKLETYNDGDGVTTIAWLNANFNPVKPGSDEAVYVKMISSSGDMAFFHVAQERGLEWNEEDHPRDDAGKFSSSGGSSKSTEHLSKGKVHGRELISGSINHVERIALVEEGKHPVNDAVEAIFKPTSGESWTYEDVSRKEIEAYKAENDANTADIQAMIEEGELGGGYEGDEPIRETITNRDFSYADREAAAYELDEALGLNVVPPTIVREIDGKRGMVQQFVDVDPSGMYGGKVDQDSVYGLAVIDIATGNTDRHSGNVLIDKDRRVVAIDQGLSFPDDTEYHPNYQFRPDATLSLLANHRGAMSEEMSGRVAKSLESTNWEKVSNDWKMSEGERDGFIARMERLKIAFKAPDAMSRSYAVRTLISEMAKESNIAAGHLSENVVHIDTDHVRTEISQ
jgi:hypothetical protein